MSGQGSKARFQGSSHNVSNIKVTKASSNSAAKKGGKEGPPTGSGMTGPPGKSGPVQVIFNGKIVTPQSLIPRKSHHHDGGKKSK
jgi:hypothetical protein